MRDAPAQHTRASEAAIQYRTADADSVFSDRSFMMRHAAFIPFLHSLRWRSSVALRSRSSALLLAFAALCALGACGEDDGGTGPEEEREPVLTLCSDIVVPTIGPGSSPTTPTFSWTPECLIVGLWVEELDGSDMWIIERTGGAVTGTGGIAPGLVYGALPGGATEAVAARPLAVGTTYTVGLVFRFGDHTFTGSYRNFTP